MQYYYSSFSLGINVEMNLVFMETFLSPNAEVSVFGREREEANRQKREEANKESH